MRFSKLALGLVTALGMNAALAADGTVTFNGEVVAATCSVTTATANQTVTLPTVSTSALSAANATAGTTAFSINLENCTAGDEVGVRFENGANVNAAGRLNNTSTATGVDIEVLDSANNVLDLSTGGALSQTLGATATTAQFDYQARYFATAAAGAGLVNSSVEFTVIYP